jgi:hypothetical protein
MRAAATPVQVLLPLLKMKIERRCRCSAALCVPLMGEVVGEVGVGVHPSGLVLHQGLWAEHQSLFHSSACVVCTRDNSRQGVLLLVLLPQSG